METYKWQIKYIKWLSAEEMNEITKSWLSELNFIQDEQHFFEDLLVKFTSQLAKSDHFCSIRNLTTELGELKKENNTLLAIVLSHRNKLDILLDGFNQIDQEEAYKQFHKELLEAINEFLIKHKQVKKDLFRIIKTNLKTQKNNSLLIS